MASSNTSSQQIDVKVLKTLSKSNFTVYLAQGTQNNQQYAMKVFPYINGKISGYFKRELLAMNFKHPNVIRLVDFTTEIATEVGDQKSGFSSYTLMELAPYGSLGYLYDKKGFHGDEKLVRTIFNHIFQGVEYIHAKKMAHMDLKVENIMIGENFLPKIGDFDALKEINRSSKDKKISRYGTLNYRAPELASDNCFDGYAADIYSLGIMLFFLQFGFLPYKEDALVYGYDLQSLMQESDPDFFEIHLQSKRLDSNNMEAFQKLVFGMTRGDPTTRYTLEDVKKNEWYNGEIYSEKEYASVMKAKIGK